LPTVVLPHPDSPTSASVRPRASSSETPSTAFTCQRPGAAGCRAGSEKCTHRSIDRSKHRVRSHGTDFERLRRQHGGLTAPTRPPLSAIRWQRRRWPTPTCRHSGDCDGNAPRRADNAAKRQPPGIGQRRHLSGNGIQPAATPRARSGKAANSFCVYGCCGDVKKVSRGASSTISPAYITPMRVRHLRDDAEVMRDQQHAHAALGLQPAQAVENLRLDGDVERRRRLIGNQQAWIAGQRDGDHHPLLHAAGKLEGILARRRSASAMPTAVSNSSARCCAASPRKTSVPFQHLADLAAHGQHRIEAGRRLLENHRHAAAPHRRAFRLPARRSRSRPFERTSPPRIRPAAGSRRRSASAVADLPQPDSPSSAKRLAGGDLEIDPIDRQQQRTMY
jgi:hypothetical protein